MHADPAPLIAGLIIFAASIISLRLGISVAVVEILLGVGAGGFGLEPEPWMIYFAGFGGIVLTFLAGAEVDTRLLREKLKANFLIGFFSFFTPFVCGFLYARFAAGWDTWGALIAGVALSETSIAVVYSVLLETGLSRTAIGGMLLASTFVTNTGTAVALSVLFLKPDLYTLAFFAVSAVIIYLAAKSSSRFFENERFAGKIIEPEIKYIFLLLLAFIYFAAAGHGHAILPAFVLGVALSGHLAAGGRGFEVKKRLRTVAFAFITPVFFIVVGMKVSMPLIFSAVGMFAAFFAVKQGAKFIGIYFLAKKFIPDGGHVYSTLLLSTGLTFGLIALVFGHDMKLLDDEKYSVLTGVLIASAVIPTFIAQRWFTPKHSEDMVDKED